MSKVERAAIWAAEEYERITLAIAKGEETRICFMSPSTRVSWHDICKRFDMKVMGPTDQVEWHPLFMKEMRKRKLVKVLRGTEKSGQWAKRVGMLPDDWFVTPCAKCGCGSRTTYDSH